MSLQVYAAPDLRVLAFYRAHTGAAAFGEQRTVLACFPFGLLMQVLLLSARNALLSRRVLVGGWPKAGETASAEARGDPHAAAMAETRTRFAQLAFGRFATPSAISPVRAWLCMHAWVCGPVCLCAC